MKKILATVLALTIAIPLMAAEKPKIIDTFCGYTFGSEPTKIQARKLFAKKPATWVGWELEQKLKKPFRKCKKAVLAYAESNKKLYSVTIKSEPDFKISDEAAKKEFQATVDIFTEKYKDLGLKFNRITDMQVLGFLSNQQQKVTIKAEKGEFSDPKKLKRAGEKSKAYVFSVEVWTLPRLFDENKSIAAPTDLGPGSGIDAL